MVHVAVADLKGEQEDHLQAHSREGAGAERAGDHRPPRPRQERSRQNQDRGHEQRRQQQPAAELAQPVAQMGVVAHREEVAVRTGRGGQVLPGGGDPVFGQLPLQVILANVIGGDSSLSQPRSDSIVQGTIRGDEELPGSRNHQDVPEDAGERAMHGRAQKANRLVCVVLGAAEAEAEHPSRAQRPVHFGEELRRVEPV